MLTSSTSATGFKGVSPTKEGRYKAQHGSGGQTHCLGTFATAEQAALAYLPTYLRPPPACLGPTAAAAVARAAPPSKKGKRKEREG